MSDDKLDPTVELAASTSAEAAAAAAPVAAAGPEGGAGAGTAAGAEGQGHTEGLAPPPIGGVGERSSTPDEFVDATDAPASPPLSAHAHATEEVAAASAIPTSPTSTAQAAPTTAAQAIAAPTSPSAPTTTLQAPGSPTTNGDRAVELGSPISEVREKRKPSALQLDEVSAPARGSIEVSNGKGGSVECSFYGLQGRMLCSGNGSSLWLHMASVHGSLSIWETAECAHRAARRSPHDSGRRELSR